jgi:hypothetical protein
MNSISIRSRVLDRDSAEHDLSVILTEIHADGKLLVDFEDSTLSTDLLSLKRSVDEGSSSSRTW